MTRKDYELIASTLKAARPDDNDDIHDMPTRNGMLNVCDWVARELAAKLKQDNASFDRARFLKACGVAQ